MTAKDATLDDDMKATRAKEAVASLIDWIGEDVAREGLIETPHRVAKALREMTSGYRQDPKEILSKVFTAEHADQMVIVRDIDFASMCEHHMMPFTGVATIGYLPKDGRVVGLSKIPRLVHCFSRRLQLQERLTTQIAQAMQDVLDPIGVGVLIRGVHTCCALRGVESRNEMVTSALLGKFRDDPQVRAEFLGLAR